MTVVDTGALPFADLPGRRTADPLKEVEAQSSVRVVRLERTADRTAHRHPSSEEIVYVLSGTGTLWLDGERTRVGPGTLARIPQGIAHATVPDPGIEMRLVCFFPHPDLAQNTEETTIRVVEEEEDR